MSLKSRTEVFVDVTPERQQTLDEDTHFADFAGQRRRLVRVPSAVPSRESLPAAVEHDLGKSEKSTRRQNG
jgi:hypothetical protein